MTLRSPLARATMPFIVTAFIAACAATGTAGSGPFAYGFMIPGATAGAAFAIRAADTLPKFSATSSIPSTVRTRITQESITGNFDSTCTRRFGGPSVYPVIFFRSCDAARGPDADPVVIVAFGADGRPINRVAWTGPNTVTLLQPFRRF